MKLGSQIIKQMHEGLETLIIGQTLINLYLNMWFLRTGKKKLQDYYDLNLPTEEQCVWKMRLPSRAPLLKSKFHCSLENAAFPFYCLLTVLKSFPCSDALDGGVVIKTLWLALAPETGVWEMFTKLLCFKSPAKVGNRKLAHALLSPASVFHLCARHLGNEGFVCSSLRLVTSEIRRLPLSDLKSCLPFQQIVYYYYLNRPK